MARLLATLGVALLVALPGRAEARGVPGEQDAPARPALGALAAAHKSRNVVTMTGQAQQRPATKTITIKKSGTSPSTGKGSLSRASTGTGRMFVVPPAPNAPRAQMGKIHVVPYQPIRALRPSVGSVKISSRPSATAPSASAPRASMGVARFGSD